MNIKLLSNLVAQSSLGKAQIALSAGISRTTLDNVLNGADMKVSTIESLANVLGVSPSIFFCAQNEISATQRNEYEKEIERLKRLLNTKPQQSTKVVVELDVTPDEFIKMGLRDKIVQVLEKK